MSSAEGQAPHRTAACGSDNAGHSLPREIVKFGMAEQKLHGAQVLRAPVDQRGLGAPHRVCAVVGGIEPELLNPAFEDASVLPRPQMRRVVDPAWKDEVVGPQSGLLDPLLHGFARGRGDLELHWTLGLVLHDHGAGGHLVAVADVPDLQTHEMAASQLAVDSQVEEREFPHPTLHL